MRRDEQRPRYTFGDDRAAVDRLRLVAEAYAPGSRRFLAEHAPVAAGVAVDLGCGPGFSTALLRERCPAASLTGTDSSGQFLDLARRRLPDARFALHDITTTPLPGTPADVLYARLVLAHLPDPVAVTGSWIGELAPGGVLLVEDLEAIDAPAGALQDYDELATDMVRAGGGVMYAGSDLAPLGGTRTAVTVPAGVAAGIYTVNVRRWMTDPAVTLPRERLVELLEDLEAWSAHDHGRSVSWLVRQVALRP